MFTKIGRGHRKSSGVTVGEVITIHYVDEDTGSKHKDEYPENARPAFHAAMDALAPMVFAEVLGIEPGYCKSNITNISSVNFVADDENTLVFVTVKVELSDGAEWTFNTPKFALSASSTELESAVRVVIDEAEAYMGGERAQMKLAI